MKIICFDPGDSTGWVQRTDVEELENGEYLSGGTIYKDLDKIWHGIVNVNPDIIVFETFHLYPGAAKHLTYNDFYPCQVIGVIKHAALFAGTPHLVEQAPSIKKYSGGIDARFSDLMALMKEERGEDLTEHIKDAYLHLKYFEMHTEKDKKKLGKWKLPESL